jgi:hypothetical protein
MTIGTFGRTGLTGGASTDLDGIDGAGLSEGHRAFVITDEPYIYFYRLNATSGAAESSPDIIAPDNNAGQKRWVLVEVYGSATLFSEETVADEAEITLATGVSGWGFAQAGDNEQWIQFTFTAAGVVTVIANSALAVNTDTDGNLCVYDAGSGIAIKNRLGSSKTIRYAVNYSA